MPEAAAGHVGPRARVAGQMGDQQERDPADTEAGPREFRRGVLRQVEEQNRSGCEDVATGDHVDGGVPPGGGHHEAVPAQTPGRVVRDLLQGGADLHRAGVHVQRQPAGLPEDR